MFKTCLSSLGTFSGNFGIFKCFRFFWNFSKPWPSIVHWAIEFTRKITSKRVQKMFKLFGNIFGQFCNLERTSSFSKPFPSRNPLYYTSEMKFRKTLLKTSFKHVWTLLGSCLTFMRIKEKGQFFRNLSISRATRVHWAIKVFEKITSEHVQNFLKHFGKVFGQFWKFQKISIFWNFSTLRPSIVYWAKKYAGKITSKHLQNMLRLS